MLTLGSRRAAAECGRPLHTRCRSTVVDIDAALRRHWLLLRRHWLLCGSATLEYLTVLSQALVFSIPPRAAVLCVNVKTLRPRTTPEQDHANLDVEVSRDALTLRFFLTVYEASQSADALSRPTCRAPTP